MKNCEGKKPSSVTLVKKVKRSEELRREEAFFGSEESEETVKRSEELRRKEAFFS